MGSQQPLTLGVSRAKRMLEAKRYSGSEPAEKVDRVS